MDALYGLWPLKVVAGESGEDVTAALEGAARAGAVGARLCHNTPFTGSVSGWGLCGDNTRVNYPCGGNMMGTIDSQSGGHVGVI